MRVFLRIYPANSLLKVSSTVKFRNKILFLNNYIMAFRPNSRDWSMIKLPKKAAVTYTLGMFIYNDETDNVPVTTTSQNNLLGIVAASYASSATTTDIYMWVPNSVNSTFYADGGSGTLTKAMEGDQFDFAADGLSIAQAASIYDTVTLVKFINASTGIFTLNVLHGKD